MPPLSDEQRRAYVAIGRLERRGTEAQARADLRREFPGLTEGEIDAAVASARNAMARSVGLSFAGEEDSIAGAAGTPGEWNHTFVVEVTITIDVPGREREYRTVRYNVTGAEMVGELNKRIDADVGDMEGRYGIEGSTYGRTVRYIL